MRGLLAYLSLFLKIDKSEWMVVKFSRESNGVAGEMVKLRNTRGAKAKEPKFRFELFGFSGWAISRWTTKTGGWFSCDNMLCRECRCGC